MKQRRCLAALSALLAFTVMAAACGGGSNAPKTSTAPSGTAGTALTLEEYFQRVEELDSQASDRFQQLEGQLGTSVAPEQALQVIRDAIVQQAAIERDLLAGLQKLQPPSEVQTEHQEAIDALTAFIEFAQRESSAVATATNIVDAAAILNSPEATDANTRLQESCQGLQQAASDHDIQITLECGGP